MAGTGLDLRHDLFQGILLLALVLVCHAPAHDVADETDEVARQILRLSHHIGQAGVNGALGHGIELRRFGILHEHQPGLLLDRTQAQGAVRTHAGKDDADAESAPIFRKGAEKEIDGQMEPMRRLQFMEMEHAMPDRQILVRRDDVDVVGLGLHAFRHLLDRHRRHPLQQLGHQAFPGRIEMLDDDIGHAGVLRNMTEEDIERFEPSSGGADPDDGEFIPGHFLGPLSHHGRACLFSCGGTHTCFVHAYILTTHGAFTYRRKRVKSVPRL